MLELAGQYLFNPRNRFENFSEVERRILGVTHTQQRLSPELLRSVREKFEGFMDPEGGTFCHTDARRSAAPPG
ncbi:hypothetical protein SAMN04244572_02162 [Azotobacter beijerinckii]|uniref:Uncharacterized protein n=1 Tax=Azotobacter beijerinckii TaxID=170623 RepID=A0A1H6V072_9GAMM|nr:hypothetical protein [Azotobacter beijerinckii]SEI93695.1 hypothetical protein SAMN04244572_02162 [Azotobacter beijerinckii]